MKLLAIAVLAFSVVASVANNDADTAMAATTRIDAVPVAPNGLIDLHGIVFREFLSDPNTWNLGQTVAHTTRNESFMLLDRQVAEAFDLIWKETSASDGARMSQDLWRRCMNYRWFSFDEVLEHLVIKSSSSTDGVENDDGGELLMVAEKCQRESSIEFNEEMVSRLPSWESDHHELFQSYGRLVIELGSHK